MVKIAIFQPAVPYKWPKNQNFKKSLCTPLDTSKRYLWSKFGVSRTFLAPKSVKIFVSAINSSTYGGFCVYFSTIYYNSLQNHT